MATPETQSVLHAFIWVLNKSDIIYDNTTNTERFTCIYMGAK